MSYIFALNAKFLNQSKLRLDRKHT